ncbi:hypothetical protein [Paractinoplanes deccanensis]|nr:hypothetical protein [Actinoplanes deccanensis]
MVGDETLAALGSVIVGFGIAAFVFRLQRELHFLDEQRRAHQAGEPGPAYWLPWADRLLIGVVTIGLLLVLFPIALSGGTSTFWAGRVPAAAASGSTVALAGYVPALLAHYRFGPRPARKWIWFGPSLKDRSAGEPAEKVVVLVSALLGIGAAAASLLVTA